MHLIENKGVKSECMKFGENSRQMPSVLTICDEYCRKVVCSVPIFWPIHLLDFKPM